MSVPSSISQLSPTPSLNSPAGSEAIGNNLALYLNAHAAFIAQLSNGSGLNITQAVSMNSFQINNLAAGTASTDAVNKAQLNALLPINTIVMYSGAVSSISTAFGTGWALCNGQNGTPNLMDKFVVGAGSAYAVGAIGGSATTTLSIANLPAHNHTITDNGHAHSVADPGHAHSVYDPGHSHSQINFAAAGQSYFGNGTNNLSMGGGAGAFGFGGTPFGTSSSATGIGIYTAYTGISIYAAGTGITINNTGSGAAVTTLPPYYALCYVMKISNS